MVEKRENEKLEFKKSTSDILWLKNVKMKNSNLRNPLVN